MARWLGREPDLRPKGQAPSYNMGVVCCSYKLSPTRANVRSVPEADKSLSVCADRLKVGAAWNEFLSLPGALSAQAATALATRSVMPLRLP